MNATRKPRRRVAFLAACCAALVAVAAALGGVPTQAHAATLQVGVTVTGLQVSGTKPDDTVTLIGTITNTGDVPAYGVHVVWWRSQDPIQDLPTLAKATTNPSSSWGAQLWSKPEHWTSVTNSVTAFAPGATAPFELRATLADLGFDTRGAAYAVGARVLATADMSSNYQLAGDYRTVVSLPAKKPVPVTSVVVLSAPPTKLLTDTFRNENLVAELSGRLDALLTAAGRLSWVVDPALLDEVRDLADGYRVGTGTKAVEGTGSAVAASWLARFEQLDRDAGARTLYANPDVNGARVAADSHVVPRAQAAGGDVAGVDTLPLLVLPAGGTVSQPTYDFLADSGATAIVAANTAQAGALQSGTAEPLLLRANSLATDTDLAAQAIADAEAVVAGASGVVRLIDTPEAAAAAEVLPSWQSERDLGDLLAADPSRPAELTSTKPERLSKAQFAAVEKLAGDFETFAELAPESTLPDEADGALSRAVSSAFIGAERLFDDHFKELAELASAPAVGRSVTLGASPRFLMSAHSNQFPVTVTNNLAEPIRVKVVVTTDNPQRLKVPDSELVDVAPGQSVTVNIHPEATSNGLVQAKAHVATESGSRVTPDTKIIFEVTDLGLVAWIIVIVSGIVLVGATAWRIRQVRRRDQASAQAAASTTDASGSTSSASDTAAGVVSTSPSGPVADAVLATSGVGTEDPGPGTEQASVAGKDA